MRLFSNLRYMNLVINASVTLTCLINGAEGYVFVCVSVCECVYLCVCAYVKVASNENDPSTSPNLLYLSKYLFNAALLTIVQDGVVLGNLEVIEL